jgi:hypothetical protein
MEKENLAWAQSPGPEGPIRILLAMNEEVQPSSGRLFACTAVVIAVVAMSIASCGGPGEYPRKYPASEAEVAARNADAEPVQPALTAAEEKVAQKHGPPPVLSSWDGLAPEVAEWFRANLKDPDSCEVLVASEIGGSVDRGWTQMVTYRAKNSFGGYDKESRNFVISNGQVVSTTGSD